MAYFPSTPALDETYAFGSVTYKWNGSEWVPQFYSGNAAGSNNEIQYNADGTLAGMSGSVWDNTNRSLVLTGATVTSSKPILDLSQTWNNAGVAFNGLALTITDTASNTASTLLTLKRNTEVKFRVMKGGGISFANDGAGGGHLNISGGILELDNGMSAVVLNNGGGPVYANDPFYIGYFQNRIVTLAADAADILALRNSTTAQTFRVYNTYTNGSNYERGVFDWTTTANALTIGTQAAGSGTIRGVNLDASNGAYLLTQRNTNCTLYFEDGNGYIKRTTASNIMQFAPSGGVVNMQLQNGIIWLGSSGQNFNIYGLNEAAAQGVFAISPKPRAGNSGDGHHMTISAGEGSTATTGSAGGNCYMAGGAAHGSGDNAGGHVYIDSGAPTGSGAAGNIYLGNTRGNVIASKLSATNIDDRIKFLPTQNEPPSTNYATLDTRNGHPVLDFDDTTAESAVFTGVMLRNYAGLGITVDVAYSMTSDVANTCGWIVALERIGDQQLDIDSDSFGANQTITAVTVPATSGYVDVVSVGVTDGANMDSIAAGEQFRIKIWRDVANDTASGDAELHWITIRET